MLQILCCAAESTQFVARSGEPINIRIGGAEPDMKKYGFRPVEPLRVVLRRHADEAACKSEKL